MTRKSPYKHRVSGHYRDGVFIERYERGRGKKRVDQSSIGLRSRASGGNNFNVAFSYTGEPVESHDLGASGFTAALRRGLGMMLTPKEPQRVQIRRLGT